MLEIKKMTTKVYTIIFVVGIVLSAVLFFNFFLQPQQDQIISARNTLSLQRQRVAVVESFVRSHPDADNYLAELDAKLMSAQRLLPEQTIMSALLLEIQQAAQDSGVRLLRLKPQKVVVKADYSEIPIEVAIRGNYFSQLKFNSYLENRLRFSIVNKVNIQAQQGILDTKLTIIFYDYVTKNSKINSKG